MARPDPTKNTTTGESLGTCLDGLVSLQRLPGTRYISARFRVRVPGVSAPVQIRRSTKETDVARAAKRAQALYIEAQAAVTIGQDPTRRHRRLDHQPDTFGLWAERFFADAAERRRRSPAQWRNLEDKWTMLAPPLPQPDRRTGVAPPSKPPVVVNGQAVAETPIAAVNTAWLEALRDVRATARNRRGKAISNATLKKDIQFAAQVLKYAARKKAIPAVPDMPRFGATATHDYTIGKEANPAMTADEARHLFAVGVERIDGSNSSTVRAQRTMAYCFAHVCIDAALRVDEGLSIRWQDVLEYQSGDQTFVRLEVLSKHTGSRTREVAIGTAMSAAIFRDMRQERPGAKPDDLVFTDHRDTARAWFKAAGLRETPRGVRTRKCYRVTGITMRIEDHFARGRALDAEGIAKWARTSPEMIRAYYDQSHPEHAGELVLRRPVPAEPPVF
jgi:hypothetical protein